jgi:hypothetical protein
VACRRFRHGPGAGATGCWRFTYAAVVALTMYVMIDMEDPRVGLIRIGAADLAMTRLRDSMP